MKKKAAKKTTVGKNPKRMGNYPWGDENHPANRPPAKHKPKPRPVSKKKVSSSR